MYLSVKKQEASQNTVMYRYKYAYFVKGHLSQGKTIISGNAIYNHHGKGNLRGYFPHLRAQASWKGSDETTAKSLVDLDLGWSPLLLPVHCCRAWRHDGFVVEEGQNNELLCATIVNTPSGALPRLA